MYNSWGVSLYYLFWQKLKRFPSAPCRNQVSLQIFVNSLFCNDFRLSCKIGQRIPTYPPPASPITSYITIVKARKLTLVHYLQSYRPYLDFMSFYTPSYVAALVVQSKICYLMYRFMSRGHRLFHNLEETPSCCLLIAMPSSYSDPWQPEMCFLSL